MNNNSQNWNAYFYQNTSYPLQAPQLNAHINGQYYGNQYPQQNNGNNNYNNN